jgi:glycosyltransferase involved in cell wall biosynthesis
VTAPGQRLSVIVITKNEERNIAACLASVQWADEIVVVDAHSSDRTVELARRFTDMVIVARWRGYVEAKNLAIRQATGDWILWLDADERAMPGLEAEVRAEIGAGMAQPVAYRVARRAYFLGTWIRHCGWYPGRVVRLFRKDAAEFIPTDVHERLAVRGETGDLATDLLHLTDENLFHYFAKFNRYTSLAAADLGRKGRVGALSDLLVRPPFMFIKMYVLQRGFLDGMPGFILSIASSAYVFTKYAKLYESTRLVRPVDAGAARSAADQPRTL